MQCRRATYSDRDAWDDYALCHDKGSAYHLFAWKDAIEESYGFCGVYLLAENECGICGILPMIDFRVPVFKNALISLPYCDAGGILANDPETEQALITHAMVTAGSMRTEIKIRSFKPLQSCGQNRTGKVSMVLALPEDSESLLAGFKSKLRSQVKKTTRDGLSVRLGKAELVDAFYQVFAENMHELGSPVHDRLWLRSVVAHYGERVRVAVVYTPDQIPVAAGILLLHPSRASVPWASSLRRYNRMAPNMLLYWTLLSFATDQGYPRFDFGRSTPGEGTYRFKQQWGAQPEPLYWYENWDGEKITHQSSTLKSGFANRMPSGKRVAENVWQRLPRPGTDWLGPKIRKYISL